ncbi:MAG: hypothetical protein HY784_15225, partial [Chloroflexi bacterium]|nr:hypothetical protein [Chloroflexota bacterium]
MAAKQGRAKKRKAAPRRYGQSDAPGGLAPGARKLADLFFRVALGLLKYWDDLLAITLLVFALVSALGIAGVTSGRLVDPWASLLQTWLGWGAALVPLTVGAVGVGLLARSSGRPVQVSWGRVLAGEVAIFAVLGGLSVL